MEIWVRLKRKLNQRVVSFPCTERYRNSKGCFEADAPPLIWYFGQLYTHVLVLLGLHFCIKDYSSNPAVLLMSGTRQSG